MGFLDHLEQTAAWLKQRDATSLGKRERPKCQPDAEPLVTFATKRKRAPGCMGCAQYGIAVSGQQRVVSGANRDPMDDEITKVYKTKAKRQEPSAAVPTRTAVCGMKIGHSTLLEPVIAVGMHAASIHLVVFPGLWACIHVHSRRSLQ